MKALRGVLSRLGFRRDAPAARRRGASPAVEPRAIRVFVSSSFVDMEAERDELVKWTFPALRRLCERRGVAWTAVDLRWGIPGEDEAEYGVLPLCIAEIDRCRPYFIGLLGDRYGSVPRELPAELLAREPWCAAHRGASIMELEMLHGVLNRSARAAPAYFYFRDPAFAVPGAEEPGRRDKLAALKRRIRKHHLAGRLRAAPREGYGDPQHLGRLVLADFTQLIDETFPERSLPDAFYNERLGHAAFAATRREVHVARLTSFARLDTHADGDGVPLAVAGDAGAGKTALLANWAARYRERHPGVFVFEHYVGATRSSADWAAMLKRLIGELNRRFLLGVAIPQKLPELRFALGNALRWSAERGRIVLVLDGLDQLEDRNGARELTWLPPNVPPRVRIVLAMSDRRVRASAAARGWPSMTVPPLTLAERRALVARYVREKHGGRLSREQTERIVAAPQAANPLFLRTLLDELRALGERHRLDDRIAFYLAAPASAELYALVLERWESDYERDRPGLVGDALRLIWAARRGLAESELLDLLGSDGAPLPQAVWAPFHLAVWDALVDRSGTLGFFHEGLRRAVERKYFERDGDATAAHLRLAKYFGARRDSARAVDELPWQLAQAGAWPELHALLGRLEFFKRAWLANEFDVKAWWARMERDGLEMVQAYQGVLDAPEGQDPYALGALHRLLVETGHLDAALRIVTYLADYHRGSGNDEMLAAAVGSRAQILADLGDFDASLALHEDEAELCRKRLDLVGVGKSLRGQAWAARSLGQIDRALWLYRESELLAREIQDVAGLAGALVNQALLLRAEGDPERALRAFGEAEYLSRRLGDVVSVHRCRINRASILITRGDFDGAVPLLDEAERLYAELGYRAGLHPIYVNQAIVRNALGDTDGAAALLDKAEDVCRELGDSAGLELVRRKRAVFGKSRGRA